MLQLEQLDKQFTTWIDKNGDDGAPHPDTGLFFILGMLWCCHGGCIVTVALPFHDGADFSPVEVEGFTLGWKVHPSREVSSFFFRASAARSSFSRFQATCPATGLYKKREN